MEPTAPSRPTMTWLPCADGLRATAAILVFFQHASFLTYAMYRSHAGGVLARFDVAPTIFFALSGFLLFLPAFYFARRPRWAVLYAIYVAVALLVTGVWAIFSTSPAGVFTFPNNGADAVLHITTGVVFAVIAAIQLGLNRQAVRESAVTPL